MKKNSSSFRMSFALSVTVQKQSKGSVIEKYLIS